MTVQLLGIGNAIVDVLAHVDDEVLETVGAPPGSMTLIDEPRAREIYALMGPATEVSGGSVANTVAGFANLGGAAAYIGRIRADQLGDIFEHDMRSLGVDVRLPPAAAGAPTARSHILITADGQRTMQTYLGACTELAVADITERTVGTPAVALLEGYVWDIAEGPALMAEAVNLVHRGSGKVALSLSDSFCVERHLGEFADFVRDSADIVVANEKEITELFGVDDLDGAVQIAAGTGKLFAITRSGKGSVIVRGDDRVVEPARPIEKLVDTTGAGDAYTAGFLYAYAGNAPLERCARLGSACAAHVIQRVGARIEPGAVRDFE